MFKFKATLAVPSAAEAKINRLFESFLTEQLSKRVENDFLLSFNENELKIEFYDVEFTENLASRILGCGTVKKFYIENQEEPKNKPEKEIEAKVKAVENEHVTGSESEAESETKKEENESDLEDDTDANAEAGVEETESEPEPEEVPEAEAEEEIEVTSKTKAEEKTESKLEAEAEKKPNVEAEHESEKEKFSLDYVEEMFEKAETVTHFYEDLAEYAQIPSELKEDFVEFMMCARNVDSLRPLFPIFGIATKYSSRVDFYMVSDELPRCTREIDPAKKEVFSKTIEETLGVSIEWFVCDVVNIVISHPSKPVFKRQAEAEDESESEAKTEEIPEVKAEEEPKSEPEPKATLETKTVEETTFEEFSKEYIEKIYKESENIEAFSIKLADYVQITDDRIRKAFEELIKAVEKTQKMSWFCIENIITKTANKMYEQSDFNTNTKLLISKAVKEKFNLTLLAFLKLIKESMEKVKVDKAEISKKQEEKFKPEKLSEECLEKMYNEAKSMTEFYRELANYTQIYTGKMQNAFITFMKIMERVNWKKQITSKDIDKILEKAEIYEKIEPLKKKIIFKIIEEKFEISVFDFVYTVEEVIERFPVKPSDKETKAESEKTSSPRLETEDPKAEAEEKAESKPEEEEPKAEAEEKAESKPEDEEPKAEAEEKTESNPEEEEPKAEAEEKTESNPEEEEPKAEAKVETDSNEVFAEYWSGIFKCMPKIISTDTYRIENASKKEQQFLAINKSNPMAFRIKEVLEIMEDVGLVADSNFINLSEKIFTKVPVIKVEKSMPLYEKMRLLQWSKALQKFVQKYYTNDLNFRVRIEDFMTELREIIMTPEEIEKIK